MQFLWSAAGVAQGLDFATHLREGSPRTDLGDRIERRQEGLRRGPTRALPDLEQETICASPVGDSGEGHHHSYTDRRTLA